MRNIIQFTKRTIGILCLGILFYHTVSAQTWQQVWADEFNGTEINSTNWTFNLGAGGWGNNELEYYTARPENAIVRNGSLHIIARKENYQGAAYTSARLKTQGLKDWKYGKIESRMKLPAGKGMWPAFWMLGSNISQVSWPACGEIDIMEHVNNEPNVEGTIHWNSNGHVQYGGKELFNLAAYHVYSIEWDDQSIRWFLDENQFHEANIARNINSTEEFHLPFFLILNVAVGGNWPGAPDLTTAFPDTLIVDYVRVYQDAPTRVIAASATNSVFNIIAQENNLTIHFPAETKGITELCLYDAMGKKVGYLLEQSQSNSNSSITYDMTHLPKGLYFITGFINNNLIVEKVLKD